MSEEPGGGAGKFGAIMLLVLGGLGYATWRNMNSRQAPALDTRGFDVAVGPATQEPAPDIPTEPAAPPPAQTPSSLGMITRPAPLASGQAPAAAAAPRGINEIAKQKGAKVSAFTKRFREKHPVMKKYSQEWLAQPDLKKLNDDYLRDRDLLKFTRGLTASKSFGPLVKKIAGDPSTRALAMEFMTGVAREAPPELASAAADLVNEDKTLFKLIGVVSTALGLPPGMVSSLTGGAVDEKAVSQKVNAAAQSAPVR